MCVSLASERPSVLLYFIGFKRLAIWSRRVEFRTEIIHRLVAELEVQFESLATEIFVNAGNIKQTDYARQVYLIWYKTASYETNSNGQYELKILVDRAFHFATYIHCSKVLLKKCEAYVI